MTLFSLTLPRMIIKIDQFGQHKHTIVKKSHLPIRFTPEQEFYHAEKHIEDPEVVYH